MRYKIFIVVLILLSCNKKKSFDSIAVFGHAGMGLNIENSLYHDNSMEAIELALSIEGCDGVEIDVQMDANGKLWLYHDPELASETNKEGCVPGQQSTNLDEAYYTTINKEKLISPNDIDPEYLKGKTIFLDIRHYDDCNSSFVNKDLFIQRLTEVCDQFSDAEQIYCILSNSNWIESFLNEGLTVLYNFDSSATIEIFNTYPGLSGIVVKNSEIDKTQVDDLKSIGKKVFIFEIRSPKGIRSALKKYPNGVITDDIRTTLIEKY